MIHTKQTDTKMEKLNPADIANIVNIARMEDVPEGDATTEITIDPALETKLYLKARQDFIFCGAPVFEEVLRAYGPGLAAEMKVQDGDSVAKGDVIAVVSGKLQGLLSAERIFLNFLQRMSAIATLTAEYVKMVEGTGLKIYDTRKTTPGMRALEKYAVRCGGGCNHRMSLSDGVMLKDNHFAHIGDSPRKKLEELVEKSRARKGVKYVCVEVDRLDQLEIVLEVEGVDLVLLDNMTCEQLSEAVRMRDASGSKAELEASGGITRKTLREIAQTGVDRVSVGALTCSAGVVDMGLDETA